LSKKNGVFGRVFVWAIGCIPLHKRFFLKNIQELILKRKFRMTTESQWQQISVPNFESSQGFLLAVLHRGILGVRLSDKTESPNGKALKRLLIKIIMRRTLFEIHRRIKISRKAAVKSYISLQDYTLFPVEYEHFYLHIS